MMSNFFKRRVFWLLAAATILVAIIVGGCSVTGPVQPTSVAPPQPTDTVLPTPAPLLACESSEFALPDSLVAAGKKLDRAPYLSPPGERFAEQRGWLSVRLDLAQVAVQYADPVPFRITITNERDHRVIFVRPQITSFLGDPNIPATFASGLQVDMVSFSGERVRPESEADIDVGLRSSPPKEKFSMLPPRKSCTVDLQLRWDRTFMPLGKPIPAGTYRMSLTLLQYDLGPGMGKEANLDIGAWVGFTDPSNEVVLTILPPEK